MHTLFIILILAGSACQKTIWDFSKYQRISVVQDGLRYDIHITDKRPEPINRMYFWFANRQINQTKNAYDGRLLHDKYLVYNGDFLVEKGQFNTGLKSGEWMKWEQNNLQTIYNYKNGELNGEYKIFHDGNLTEKGSYNDGLREGEISFIHLDSVYVLNFNKGRAMDTIQVKKSVK